MPPLRLLRLANPVVRAILSSPAHGLLSSRLLVLIYRGRRTGRRFAIPLRYVETGDGELVSLAVDRERKLWWRSFIEPAPVFVLLRGERLAVLGALVEGARRQRALAAYVGTESSAARLTEGAAVVVFSPTR